MLSRVLAHSLAAAAAKTLSPIRLNLDLWNPQKALWLMDLKDLIALHRDGFTTNPYSVFFASGCEIIFSLLAATVSLCCTTLLWHKGAHRLLMVSAWSSNSHLYNQQTYQMYIRHSVVRNSSSEILKAVGVAVDSPWEAGNGYIICINHSFILYCTAIISKFPFFCNLIKCALRRF